MASYRENQEFVRRRHGFTPKMCWIAHVKDMHDLTRGSAPNRKGERQYPCPPQKRAAIDVALRDLGVI